MEKDKELLIELSGRIDQLLSVCDGLKEQNNLLQNQLSSKEEEFKALIEKHSELEKGYKRLKIGRMLIATSDDVDDAKRKISKLIRQVDSCIALLND